MANKTIQKTPTVEGPLKSKFDEFYARDARGLAAHIRQTLKPREYNAWKNDPNRYVDARGLAVQAGIMTVDQIPASQTNATAKKPARRADTSTGAQGDTGARTGTTRAQKLNYKDMSNQQLIACYNDSGQELRRRYQEFSTLPETIIGDQQGRETAHAVGQSYNR